MFRRKCGFQVLWVVVGGFTAVFAAAAAPVQGRDPSAEAMQYIDSIAPKKVILGKVKPVPPPSRQVSFQPSQLPPTLGKTLVPSPASGAVVGHGLVPPQKLAIQDTPVFSLDVAPLGVSGGSGGATVDLPSYQSYVMPELIPQNNQLGVLRRVGGRLPYVERFVSKTAVASPGN